MLHSGPALVSIYVNDFPCHPSYTSPFLYADDMALVAHGNSVSEIELKLQNDLTTARN